MPGQTGAWIPAIRRKDDMRCGDGRLGVGRVRVPRGVWIAMIHRGLDSRLRGSDGWLRE